MTHQTDRLPQDRYTLGNRGHNGGIGQTAIALDRFILRHDDREIANVLAIRLLLFDYEVTQALHEGGNQPRNGVDRQLRRRIAVECHGRAWTVREESQRPIYNVHHRLLTPRGEEGVAKQVR